MTCNTVEHCSANLEAQGYSSTTFASLIQYCALLGALSSFLSNNEIFKHKF